MIVEIIPEGGVGAKPLVVRCNQLLVRNDDGTPIGAFAVYGPDESVTAGIAAVCRHCNKGHGDFNNILRQLGVRQTVVIETVRAHGGPPAGAVLLRSPEEY